MEGAAGDKIVVVNGQAQQGIAMETSQEPTSQSAETGLGPIGSFLLKTVIVCAAIIVSGWIMLDLLDDFATRRMEQLERSVRAATSLGGHRFWTKLENELDRMADPRTDLSPEKKQKNSVADQDCLGSMAAVLDGSGRGNRRRAEEG